MRPRWSKTGLSVMLSTKPGAVDDDVDADRLARGERQLLPAQLDGENVARDADGNRMHSTGQ